MTPKLIKSLDWLVAIVLSGTVVVLLILRTTHAGPLWRDEAAAVQLARLSTLHEVAANFQHEAFPLPFPLLIRTYTGIFGSSDLVLRCFGLIVGLATVGVAWFNSRALGATGPTLFLPLFGLSGGFLIWGTALRGYGLGCALLLLTLGLTIRAVQRPNRGNAVAATIAAAASVQVLVNALPLIASMAAAALLAFVINREFRRARMVCLCATITFLSFLPYVKSYAGADWTIVLKYPRSIYFYFTKFWLALGAPNHVAELCWGAAALLFLAVAVWHVIGPRKQTDDETRAVRFTFFFVPIALVAYFAFLKILSYATQPWYYLPLICTLAAALELNTILVGSERWLGLARIGFALGALFQLPISPPAVFQRFTNIDVVAHRLETDAAPGDLVVVNPWHFGPSFYRYYHGSTPWITNPVMNEHRFHRYDLMKAKMMETDPLKDVFFAIQQTLQSYHRVWIVGGARPPEEGMPIDLGPAPNPQLGWAGYMSAWSIQLGTFLKEHVVAGDVVIDRPPYNAINSENVPLLVGEGWRD